MSEPTLFIDRDGTLIEEPPDHQVDSLSKVRFMPGVFQALRELSERGFRLVMVSNQDGLGSREFPQDRFQESHDFVLETFRAQGIYFDAAFICPHREADQCACRKPKTGLVTDYLERYPMDPERSAVIGDRGTDLGFAKNLNLRGFTVCRHGSPDQTWPATLAVLTARHAALTRNTKETRMDVRVNLENPEPLEIETGIGFFDHMLEQLAKHGGFALELTAAGDLRVDEHHTIEDSALALGQVLRKALGEKRGIARYGFVVPMDEAEARVSLDLSGRAFALFEGRFNREKVGELPTELVPHFFRSLSEGLSATLHIEVKGENTHHMVESCFKGVGRALRQAIRLEGRDVPSTKGVL